MKEYSEQEIQSMYDRLPKDVHDAMFSVDTGKVLVETGKKYRLHIDQQGELSRLVGYLMLGIIHPQDFMSELRNGLRVDQQRAREIVQDINEKIFKPIRSSLKEIHKVGDKDTPHEAESRAQTPPATPEIAMAPPSAPNTPPANTSSSEEKHDSSVNPPKINHQVTKVTPMSNTPNEQTLSEKTTTPRAESSVLDASSDVAVPKNPHVTEDIPVPTAPDTTEPAIPKAPNIAEEKLKKIVKNPHENKTNTEDRKTSNNTPRQNDPYREPIE